MIGFSQIFGLRGRFFISINSQPSPYPLSKRKEKTKRLKFGNMLSVPPSLVSLLLLLQVPCLAFTALPTSMAIHSQVNQLGHTKASPLAAASDTPTTLPEFESKEAYMQYLATVSALPKGFATGSGAGKFIPKEAPSMGHLPIKGTIIHLTEGPTDSWAAVFTSNKVGILF